MTLEAKFQTSAGKCELLTVKQEHRPTLHRVALFFRTGEAVARINCFKPPLVTSLLSPDGLVWIGFGADLAVTVCGCPGSWLCFNTTHRCLSREQRLDQPGVWSAAVSSCPGTTGCDTISKVILSHTESLFPVVKLPRSIPTMDKRSLVSRFFPSEQLSAAPQAALCFATHASAWRLKKKKKPPSEETVFILELTYLKYHAKYSAQRSCNNSLCTVLWTLLCTVGMPCVNSAYLIEITP